MINLRVHTSFNFGKVFGPIQDVEKINEHCETNYLVITDENTYGYHYLEHYVPKLEERTNKKIIYGLELNVVDDVEKAKHFNSIEDKIVLLACNLNGVKLLYKLCTLSFKNKTNNISKISFNDLNDLSDVIAISTNINAYYKYKKFMNKDFYNNNLYFGLSNTFDYFEKFLLDKIDKKRIVAINDNLYFKKEDSYMYEIFANAGSTDGSGTCKISANYTIRYMLSEEEWRHMARNFIEDEYIDNAIMNTQIIASGIEQFDFEKASLPHIQKDKTLLELCEECAVERGVDLNDPRYRKELELELDIIEDKKIFEDYFYIVRDFIKWSRERMMLGPARGSCAASLVCYLLGIIEIDPIPFDLNFQRFLDKTRTEMPDIDIDIRTSSTSYDKLPNRDDCIQYLIDKYNSNCVCKVGRLLNIKGRNLYRYLFPYLKELEKFDSSFNDNVDESKSKINNSQYIKLGEKLAEEYKDDRLKDIYRIYGLPISHGEHPSGVVVTDKQLINFQSVDYSNGAEIMMDLNDMDRMGILKIDCLGLETLNILQNCLSKIGKDSKWLYSLDKEDKKVYETVFKDADTVGVFQFEGEEIKEVTRKIKAVCFEDIAAITAIARPASLKAGNVDKYRVGNLDNIKFDKLKTCLEKTRGILIYQEQMMAICRDCFHAPFELVNKTRKIVSKSKGKEAIEEVKKKLFECGLNAGEKEEDLIESWAVIKSCGSYIFNKAHAVAYAHLSYFCAYLKTYYPFEFLSAILNSSEDITKNSQIIIYMKKQGYNIKLFDIEKSGLEWHFDKNKKEILGPLTNLKGISINKAQVMMKMRENGEEFKPGMKKIILSGETKYNYLDNIKKFNELMEKDWVKYFKRKPITYPDEISREEKTMVFYLLDKVEKISVKGNNYTLLKVYTGDFIRLISMENFSEDETEEDLDKIKKEKYYIGIISGTFLKKYKAFDIDNFIN